MLSQTGEGSQERLMCRPSVRRYIARQVIRGLPRTNSLATDYTKKRLLVERARIFQKKSVLILEIRGKSLAEHYHKKTFQEEYREILVKSGIPFDDRYLW